MPEKKCLEPLTYLEDKGDCFMISIDLPLVEKDGIEIILSDESLEISARMHRQCSFSGLGISGESFQSASFKKVLSLPQGADPQKARAAFSKGILEIKIPKKSSTKKISVK